MARECAPGSPPEKPRSSSANVWSGTTVPPYEQLPHLDAGVSGRIARVQDWAIN